MSFIDHINLRIPEEKIEEALKFYRDLIGLETWKLEEHREGQRTLFFFRIGENALINIRPKEDFKRPSGKEPGSFLHRERSGHRQLQKRSRERRPRSSETGRTAWDTGKSTGNICRGSFRLCDRAQGTGLKSILKKADGKNVKEQEIQIERSEKASGLEMN